MAPPGGVGPGTTAAWSCACLWAWVRGLRRLPKDWISGPSLGNRAWSRAPRGRRPVGGATTGAGSGMFGNSAGAGTFASGAVHGVANAGGAKPIGTTSPITVADATDMERIRRIADMSHLSRVRAVAFDRN